MTKTQKIEQTENTAKKAALQQAFDNIVKNFGSEAVCKLGDKPLQKHEVVSSGCLSLDLALGVGGYPRGRIVEIFGPEASGKSSLCLHAAAEVHKAGGNVAFIDAEHALDLNYAQALGVNTSELFLSQPSSGEEGLSIAEEWLKSASMDLVIVDSVAALVPRSEIEGEMGDATMGVQARLMSQALRKLTAIVSKSNSILIFTNQLRQKIGVMFGNPETTTGGNALKFYATIRMDIRRIEALKEGTQVIGTHTRIKVVKNKVAPPFQQTEIDIIYGKGIDRLGDIASLAVDRGFIQKSGSWYSLNGERIAQGIEQVKEYLGQNPQLVSEFETKLKARE